jgi:hypothetical protein
MLVKNLETIYRLGVGTCALHYEDGKKLHNDIRLSHPFFLIHAPWFHPYIQIGIATFPAPNAQD